MRQSIPCKSPLSLDKKGFLLVRTDKQLEEQSQLLLNSPTLVKIQQGVPSTMSWRVQFQRWKELLLCQTPCKLLWWMISFIVISSMTMVGLTKCVHVILSTPVNPQLEAVLPADRPVISVGQLEHLSSKYSTMERFKLVGPYESLSFVNLNIPDFPDLGQLPSVDSKKGIVHALDNQYRYANKIATAMKEYTAQSPLLPYLRANACIFVLCRNKDLKDILRSMSTFEFAFNSRYNYPYVFLNDEPFTEEFKNWVIQSTKSKVEFGLIPKEDWSLPDDIDPTVFQERLDYNAGRYIYGGSKSYRFMCRYNSRLFYKHPLMTKYRYYWRMEPDIDYGCMIRYDPLLFMALTKKRYGFTIVADELMSTVEGLWNHTTNFMAQEKIPMSPFLKEGFYNPSTHDFNGNHFWSNFEIADLEFYRSELYERYMQYLDKTKGFFYERYGDAPVHTLGVAMALRPEEIHHFADISYHHENHGTCPVSPTKNDPILDELKDICWCKRDKDTWSEGNWWPRNVLSVLKPLNEYSYKADLSQ